MVDIFTYTKNVAKSAMYSAEDIVKENTPAAASFISTNREVLTALYDSARDYRTFGRRMEQYVKSSRIYEAASEGAKAVLEDLANGTFYNKERIEKFETRALGDMANFDDAFDESSFNMDTGNATNGSEDWDFGDDEQSSPNDDVVAAVHLSSKDNAQAVGNITARVGANIAAGNRANTMLMLNQQIRANSIMEKGFTSIFDRIGQQDAKVNAAMESMSSKAMEYYDKSLTLAQDRNNMIKEMLDIMKTNAGITAEEQKKNRSRTTYTDVVDANGMPDLKNYWAAIKKNAVNALPQEVKMLLQNNVGGEGANNLLAFVASPLQFVSTSITRTLIPKMITKTMADFDKTLSGAFSGMLAQFNKMANDEDAGFLQQYLGKVFGIKTKSSDTINTADYKKGTVPFDGITRKAIIEVIPGYLRRIESALTGEGERIFSYSSGKWSNARDLQKQYKNISESAYKSAYADVKEEMMSMILASGHFSRSDSKMLQDNVDKFLKRIVTEDLGNPRKLMTTRAKDMRDKYMDYNVENAELMEMLTTAFKSVSRGSRSQLSRSSFEAKESIASRIESLLRDNAEMVELFNGSDIDRGYTWSKDGGKRKAAPGHLYNNTIDKILDDKGHNLFYYLQQITRELATFRENRYGGGGSGGSTPPPLVNLPSAGAGRIARRPRPVDPIAVRYEIENISESRRETDARWSQRARELEQLEEYRKRKGAKPVWDRLDDAALVRINSNIRDLSRKWHGDMNHTLTDNYDNLYEFLKNSVDYKEYWEANHTLIDEFIAEQRAERRERGEKLAEERHASPSSKDSDETSDDKKRKRKGKGIVDRLLAAESLEEKLDVFTGGMDEILEAPGKYLSTIIMKADERLYDLIFGKEGVKNNKTGKEANGILDAMVIGIQNTFEKVNNWLDEKILDPIKKKLGIETFGDAVQKFFGIFGIDFNESRDNFTKWLFTENDFSKKLGQEIKGAFESIGEAISPGSSAAATARSEASVVNELMANQAQTGSSESYRRAIKKVFGMDQSARSKDFDNIAYKMFGPTHFKTSDRSEGAQLQRMRDVREAGEVSSYKKLMRLPHGEEFAKQYCKAHKIKWPLTSMRSDIAQEIQLAIVQAYNTEYKTLLSHINRFADAEFTDRLNIDRDTLAVFSELMTNKDSSIDLLNRRANIYNSVGTGEGLNRYKRTAIDEWTSKLEAVRGIDVGTSDISNYKIDADISKLRRGGVASNEELERVYKLLPEDIKRDLIRNGRIIGYSVGDGANGTVYNQADMDKFIAAVERYNAGAESDYKNRMGSRKVQRNNAARQVLAQIYKAQYPTMDDADIAAMLDGFDIDEFYKEGDSELKFFGGLARGSRLVTKTGLYTIHRGEAVVPSEYVPRSINGQTPGGVSKQKEIDDENRVKNRFLRYIGRKIGGAAEGLNAGDVVPDNMQAQLQPIAARGVKKLKGLTKNEYNKALQPVQKILRDAVGDETADAMKSGFEKYGAPGLGGGLVGGGVGLASSMLFGIAGGPIIGAAIGAAANIAKNSEVFSTFLFGEKTEGTYADGKQRRAGGFFDAETQEAWHKYFPSMAKGGIGGAIAGLITPFGPVGGLMIGSALGFASKNDDFQSLLFGDDGLFREEDREKVKKALPAAVVGGAVGAVALGGPFGLLGGAAIGAVTGISTTTETFKRIMLGKETQVGVDKDGNPILKRQGGIIGSIAKISLEPIKEGANFIRTTVTDFVKKDIIKPLKSATKSVGNMFRNMFTSISEGVTGALNSFFEKRLGVPVEEFIKDRILTPMGNFAKNMLGLPFKLIGNTISAPFKLLGFVGNNIRANQIKRGTDLGSTAAERLDWRDNHKIRSKKIFGFGGVDGFRKADEWINTASSEDIETLRRDLMLWKDKDKGYYELVKSRKEDIAGSVNQFFDDKKHGGFFTKNNHARHEILDLIKDEKYDEAFRKIKTLRGRDGKPLDPEQISELTEQLQSQVQLYNDAKAGRGTDANYRKSVVERLSKMGFKDTFGKTDTNRIIRMLDSEKSGRKRLGIWDENAEELVDAGNANTQQVVSAITDLTEVTRNFYNKLIDGVYTEGTLGQDRETVGFGTNARMNSAKKSQDKYRNKKNQQAEKSFVGGANSVNSVDLSIKDDLKRRFGLDDSVLSKVNTNDVESIKRVEELAPYCLGSRSLSGNAGISKDGLSAALELSKRKYKVVAMYAKTRLIPMDANFVKLITDQVSTSRYGVYKFIVGLGNKNKILIGNTQKEHEAFFKDVFPFISALPGYRRYINDYINSADAQSIDLITFIKNGGTHGTTTGSHTAVIHENEMIIDADDIPNYATGYNVNRIDSLAALRAVMAENIDLNPFKAKVRTAISPFRKGRWTRALNNASQSYRFADTIRYNQIENENIKAINRLKSFAKAKHPKLTDDEYQVLLDAFGQDSIANINNRALTKMEIDALSDYYLDIYSDAMQSAKTDYNDQLNDQIMTGGAANHVTSGQMGIYYKLLSGQKVSGKRLSRKNRASIHDMLSEYTSFAPDSELTSAEKEQKGQRQTEILNDIRSLLSYNITDDGETLKKVIDKDGKVFVDKLDPENKEALKEGRVNNFIHSAIDKISDGITNIKGFFTDKVDGERSRLDVITDTAKNIAKFVLAGLATTGGLAALVQTIAPNVAQSVGAWWETSGKQTVVNVGEGIKKWVTEDVPETASNIWDATKGYLSQFSNFMWGNMSTIATAMGQGAATAAGWMLRATPYILKGVWDGFKIVTGTNDDISTGNNLETHLGATALEAIIRGSSGSGLKNVKIKLPTPVGKLMSGPINTTIHGAGHVIDTAGGISRGISNAQVRAATSDTITKGADRLTANALKPSAITDYSSKIFEDGITSLDGSRVISRDADKFINTLYRDYGVEAVDSVISNAAKTGAPVTRGMLLNAMASSDTALRNTSEKLITDATSNALQTSYKDAAKNLTSEAAEKLIEDKGLAKTVGGLTNKQYKRMIFNVITDTTSEAAIESVTDTVGNLSKNKIFDKMAKMLTKWCQKGKKTIASYFGDRIAGKITSPAFVRKFIAPLGEYLTEKVTNGMARMASTLASAGTIDIIFAVYDFIWPLFSPANAMEVLGITTPPTPGQTFFACIINCIMGLPFLAYGLIPPSFVSYILFDVIGLNWFGIKDAREQSNEEYQAFVAAYGADNVTFDDYSYMIGNHRVGIIDGISQAVGGGEEGLLKRLNAERVKNGQTELTAEDFKNWRSTYNSDEEAVQVIAANNATDSSSTAISQQILNSLNTLVAYITGSNPNTTSAAQYYGGSNYSTSAFAQDMSDANLALYNDLVNNYGLTSEEAMKYMSGTNYGAGTGRYSQKDKSINMRFNKAGDSIYQDINSSGCGPIAATNLINRHMRYGTGLIEPQDAAKYALRGGYKETNGGTDPRYFESYFKKNGINSTITSSHSAMRNAIKNGQQVVLMGKDSRYGMGTTPYGPNPHYVVATGIHGDNIIIDNPESDNEFTTYSANETINKSTKAIITNSRYGMGSTKTLEQAEQELQELFDEYERRYGRRPTPDPITRVVTFAKGSEDLQQKIYACISEIDRLKRLGNASFVAPKNQAADNMVTNDPTDESKAYSSILVSLKNKLTAAMTTLGSSKVFTNPYDYNRSLSKDYDYNPTGAGEKYDDVAFGNVYDAAINYNSEKAMERSVVEKHRVQSDDPLQHYLWNEIREGWNLLNDKEYSFENSQLNILKSIMDDYLTNEPGSYSDDNMIALYNFIANNHKNNPSNSFEFISFKNLMTNDKLMSQMDKEPSISLFGSLRAQKQLEWQHKDPFYEYGLNMLRYNIAARARYKNVLIYNELTNAINEAINSVTSSDGDSKYKAILTTKYENILANYLNNIKSTNSVLRFANPGIDSIPLLLDAKFRAKSFEPYALQGVGDSGYKSLYNTESDITSIFSNKEIADFIINYAKSNYKDNGVINIPEYLTPWLLKEMTDRFIIKPLYTESSADTTAKDSNKSIAAKILSANGLEYTGTSYPTLRDIYNEINLARAYSKIIKDTTISDSDDKSTSGLLSNPHVLASLKSKNVTFTRTNANSLLRDFIDMIYSDTANVEDLLSIMSMVTTDESDALSSALNTHIFSKITTTNLDESGMKKTWFIDAYKTYMQDKTRSYNLLNQYGAKEGTKILSDIDDRILTDSDIDFLSNIQEFIKTGSTIYKEGLGSTPYMDIINDPYKYKSENAKWLRAFMKAYDVSTKTCRLPAPEKPLHATRYGDLETDNFHTLYPGKVINISETDNTKDGIEIYSDTGLPVIQKYGEREKVNLYDVLNNVANAIFGGEYNQSIPLGTDNTSNAYDSYLTALTNDYYNKFDKLAIADKYALMLQTLKSERSSSPIDDYFAKARRAIAYSGLIDPEIFKLFYIHPDFRADIEDETKRTSYLDNLLSTTNIKKANTNYKNNFIDYLHNLISGKAYGQMIQSIPTNDRTDTGMLKHIESFANIHTDRNTMYDTLKDIYGITSRDIFGIGEEVYNDDTRTLYDVFNTLGNDYLRLNNLKTRSEYDDFLKYISELYSGSSPTLSSPAITDLADNKYVDEKGDLIDFSGLGTKLDPIVYRDITSFSMPSIGNIRAFIDRYGPNRPLRPYAQHIIELAAEYRIDPRVALSIMAIECGLCSDTSLTHFKTCNYISIMRSLKEGEIVGAGTMADFSKGGDFNIGGVQFNLGTITNPKGDDGIKAALKIVFKFLKDVSVNKRGQKSLFSLNFKNGYVFCGTKEWIIAITELMNTWEAIDPNTKAVYIYPTQAELSYYHSLTGTALDEDSIPSNSDSGSKNIITMMLDLAKAIVGEDIWNFFSGGLFGSSNSNKNGSRVSSYDSSRRYSSLKDLFSGNGILEGNVRAPSVSSGGNFGPRYLSGIKGLADGINQHRGIDIVTDYHHSPIGSPVDGEVLLTSNSTSGYGNHVVVLDDGATGNGKRLHLFGHLSKIGVKQGDHVNMGTYLGDVGNTGASSGEHLHYGVAVPDSNNTWHNAYHISEKGNVYNDINKNTEMASATPFSDLSDSEFDATSGWINPELYMNDYLAAKNKEIADSTFGISTTNGTLTEEEQHDIMVEIGRNKVTGDQTAITFGEGSGRTISDRMILNNIEKNGIEGAAGIGGSDKPLSLNDRTIIKDAMTDLQNKEHRAAQKAKANGKAAYGMGVGGASGSATEEKLLVANNSQVELLAVISNTLKSIEATTKQNNALVAAIMEAVRKGEISPESDTYKALLKTLSDGGNIGSGSGDTTSVLVNSMLSIARG